MHHKKFWNPQKTVPQIIFENAENQPVSTVEQLLDIIVLEIQIKYE